MICTHIDYHNQHESAALICPFHATASVLTSVQSYRKLSETDAEISTGVSLLSAVEGMMCHVAGFPNCGQFYRGLKGYGNY